MLGMIEDPLIAYEWENLAFTFSFILFSGMAVLTGFLSRNIEDSIFYTAVCTASILLVYLVVKILGS